MKALNEKMQNILVVFLICYCIFYSCAAKKPGLRAAFYSFEHSQKKYRIRSVSSKDNSLFFNELIGNDFLAKDYDQDGYLDRVIMGNISLPEAQEIYESALTTLMIQNKLNRVGSKAKAYQFVNSEYSYEIKSFRSDNADPWNVFKIIDNNRIMKPHIVISIDQNADGKLDMIVHGIMSLEKVQIYYSDVIKKGLKNNKLVETDNMIFVNEK